MAGLHEFFLRLRLAGAPGAPTGTAVPRDRNAEQDVELAPVFGALSAAHAEAARVREQARAEVAAVIEAASREAAAIVRDAAQSAAAVREQSAATARRAAQASTAAIIAQARGQAELIRRHAAERVPGFVAETVRSALSELSEGSIP